MKAVGNPVVQLVSSVMSFVQTTLLIKISSGRGSFWVWFTEVTIKGECGAVVGESGMSVALLKIAATAPSTSSANTDKLHISRP